MMRDDHFRKLERMYLSAPINAIYNPEITVGEAQAVIKLTVRKKFFHAAHAVHGSVYFKCLDDCAFFAVNSLVEDTFVLTAHFNLYLLRPVESGVLIATGKVIHRSGRQFLADAELVDANGEMLAKGSGTFVRSKIPLTEDVGYK